MSAPAARECLTALLEYACLPEFAGQMQIARELYSLATGKVNDDDPFYESRMAAFQEFFTFDYRLADVYSGATVLELFLLNAQTTMAPADIHCYEQLRSFHHSLFYVEKARESALLVHDLISGARQLAFHLPDYRFDGFEPGAVFEGRLFSFEGLHYFTGAFIFHPKDVSALVGKLAGEYLRTASFCSARDDLDWHAELQRRHELLSEVACRKRETENSDKKRAVDVLNITKHLVHVSRTVSNPQLVMALGRDSEVSAFVPETAFLDLDSFLQKFAYCNVRSYRYKHIDPLKVYDLEVERVRQTEEAKAAAARAAKGAAEGAPMVAPSPAGEPSVAGGSASGLGGTAAS